MKKCVCKKTMIIVYQSIWRRKMSSDIIYYCRYCGTIKILYDGNVREDIHLSMLLRKKWIAGENIENIETMDLFSRLRKKI